MNRPTGVLVIGILGIIGGVFGILGSIAVFSAGGLATSVGAVGVGAGVMALGVIYLILAILGIIMAIAFLGLKRWAWWGLVILLAFNILFAIIMMAAWQFGASSLVGILIDAGIIYYVNTPAVKRAFFGSNAPDLVGRFTGR